MRRPGSGQSRAGAVQAKAASSAQDEFTASNGHSDAELQRLEHFERFRTRLIELYKEHEPAKLASVDVTLREWSGREEELVSRVEAQFAARQAAKEDYTRVVNSLKECYEKIRPLEETYKFDHFFSPCLTDAEFEAKPMVLLLGQYSVGKTTFIKHLIGRDFPGIRIGPEPTTDRFVAVMHGDQDQTIPGNALCVSADKPFTALSKFGTSFMSRMEASVCNSRALEFMTLVDTPGVLSGEKQRIGRQYDFPAVIDWFAGRSDRILLLFDAHKLDISDEFKTCIEALRGHEDKVRVVLNKADSVTPKQLMRVYGALMWSLGKVTGSPEVMRVYVGSFWDVPLRQDHENRALFESEAEDLLSDLRSLPRNSSLRKINELVKRARHAKVHAYIIAHLKAQMPTFFGKSSKQQNILKNLPQEFSKVAQKHQLALGDFPNPEGFRRIIQDYDLSKFPKLSEKAIRKLDTVLTEPIPALLRELRLHDPDDGTGPGLPMAGSSSNPFEAFENLGSSRSVGSLGGSGWAVSQSLKTEADNIFFSSPLQGGKLAGTAAQQAFASTGLSNNVLAKVWTLADMDHINQLDADQFAVALYLARQVQSGKSLPDTLPSSLAVAALPAHGLAAAFAYGSGVFEQIDAGTKPKGVAPEDRPLVDLVLVVEDAKEWHKLNIETHPAHYSCLASLGPEAVAKVQRTGGGFMYFNTDVTVPSVPEVRLKYGVISQEDAIRDLSQWDALYLSGRLHKPVRFIADAPQNTALREALGANLAHAMHTALLLLPDRFDDEALFRCISELSYAGDVRMGLAENPNKVANIVRGSMSHFQSLYSRFLPFGQDASSVSPSNGFVGELALASASETTGLRIWEQNMDPQKRAQMASTLPFLSGAGVLTVGTLTAFRYGMRKVRKRFAS
ncbi:EH-domain containing protein, putative [Hondaea fermentalgiana]|uniref:EH-domain containing protein, putative n=1 Tax=Hondaea fermentalgiana TaxID=2315210 RepID=A0A2R5GNV2_9STRA|nr:EH-domain containing protein, putative [Hondaea fermentalgiana]|eukprot:GBG32560.1 EH-domain containing protein, putative [Hondaea fermentalgiana]